MFKKLHLRTALLAAVLIPAVCWAALGLSNYLRDRPIPDGIVAYRAHTREGMSHTHCLCNHKGYYIITDRLVLWYLTGHDSLQPEGEIVSSSGETLTIRPIQKRLFEDQKVPDDFTIERLDGFVRINKPASTYLPATEFTLKKTHLGHEIRARVEGFDYVQWKASHNDLLE